MKVKTSSVDAIIEKRGLEKRDLITNLLDIQEKYNYLPYEALERVSKRMEIPMLKIHQVAEFYNALSLELRGEHIITVCLGTTCHVQGGRNLVDRITDILNIELGETTKDRLFTLESVNCLGCCNLAPVMIVDGKYYGNMEVNKVEKVLNQYREEEAVAHD